MPLATFPTLPGQGWSIKKTPTFSTRVAKHVSGREVRSSLYAHALYQFELNFEALDALGSRASLGANSEQALRAFYLACQGQANSFLYVDPNEYSVTDCSIGSGDGSSTQFTLYRPVGASFYEPASYVTALTNAKVSGSVVTASLLAPNVVQFAAPPANGAPLSWTGTYGWQCRFSDDAVQFENFIRGIWKVDSLKFQQVR